MGGNITVAVAAQSPVWGWIDVARCTSAKSCSWRAWPLCAKLGRDAFIGAASALPFFSTQTATGSCFATLQSSSGSGRLQLGSGCHPYHASCRLWGMRLNLLFLLSFSCHCLLPSWTLAKCMEATLPSSWLNIPFPSHSTVFQTAVYLIPSCSIPLWSFCILFKYTLDQGFSNFCKLGPPKAG